MPILEHNFSVVTNHDAAAHNSNKTAVLINHCIKQSDFFIFFFIIARLGIFGSQLTKTTLCLNRKETWEKNQGKLDMLHLEGECCKSLMTMYYFEWGEERENSDIAKRCFNNNTLEVLWIDSWPLLQNTETQGPYRVLHSFHKNK